MSTNAGIIEATLAALQANTAATEKNNELLERVIAGQTAAIDKIEAPKAARAKKSTETETPATTSAADTAPDAATETVTPAASVEVSDDDVKTVALAWMAAIDPAGAADPAKKDLAKRTACADFFKAIVENFGLSGTLTGPKSELNAEQRAQALFYIRRKAEGLGVDFNADYDFAGDPAQGGVAEADAGDDDGLG